MSALQLLAIIQKEEKSLSDLSDIMEEYPQKLFNVRIRGKEASRGLSGVCRQIQKVENKLGHARPYPGAILRNRTPGPGHAGGGK